MSLALMQTLELYTGTELLFDKVNIIIILKMCNYNQVYTKYPSDLCAG